MTATEYHPDIPVQWLSFNFWFDYENKEGSFYADFDINDSILITVNLIYLKPVKTKSLDENETVEIIRGKTNYLVKKGIINRMAIRQIGIVKRKKER